MNTELIDLKFFRSEKHESGNQEVTLTSGKELSLFLINHLLISWWDTVLLSYRELGGELCPVVGSSMINVTLHGKTDTNAFPFKLQNRLLSVYIRLNGS